MLLVGEQDAFRVTGLSRGEYEHLFVLNWADGFDPSGRGPYRLPHGLADRFLAAGWVEHAGWRFQVTRQGREMLRLWAKTSDE